MYKLLDIDGPAAATAFIDATPDGNYALRILEAYRSQCDCRWRVTGLPENGTAIYALMNAHQDQRLAELDRAIEVLKRHST